VSLAEAFENFGSSAFRLETLPTYVVDDEEPGLAAYRAGLGQPERSVRTSSWLATIAATTAQGRDWRRVRLLTEPLSFYESWELERYLETQACGEQIRLLPRRRHAELEGADFWLFDAGTDDAVGYAMQYAASGEFLGAERVGPEQLAHAERVAAALWPDGQPLNDYLAAHRPAMSD